MEGHYTSLRRLFAFSQVSEMGIRRRRSQVNR